MISNCDGTKTLEELSALSGKFNVDLIELLLIKFESLGVINTVNKISAKDIFKLRIGLFEGDKLLPSDHPVTKILAVLLLYFSLPVFLAGCVFLILNSTYVADLENLVNNYQNYIILFLITLLFITLHELGHLVIARYYKVNVPEVGIMLYFFTPLAYTNVSLLRTIKNKAHKILILLGGAFANVLLIGILLILWGLFFKDTDISVIFLLSVISNFGVIIANVVIFLKLDGYYIFQEIINEDYLREKSIGIFWFVILGVLRRFGFRTKTKYNVIEMKRMSGINDIFYICFGALSVLYIPFLILIAATNILSYLQLIQG
ncbi:MAG: hypothetical protein FWH52_00135 [Synergistaceae bacterium]|nr:hypothetical protein [Synergistaceae bacterium]